MPPMQDPTGIVSMAAGTKAEPTMAVSAITLTKGPDGSVAVKVDQGPGSGDPTKDLMVPEGMALTVDEVFPGWAEALGFVLPIVESLVPADSQPPIEDPVVEAEADIPEAMEEGDMGTPPLAANRAVEFAGQRSYRS